MEGQLKSEQEWVVALQDKLQVRVTNPLLFLTACTHRSYQNEKDKAMGNNERLEFLGDSILSAVVSEFLYERFPEFSEGELSFAKAKIVDAPTCALSLRLLELEPFLLLGKGEIANLGKGRESITADFFEALIGAIFLDQGFEGAKKFLIDRFAPLWIDSGMKKEENEKVLLQELCQKKFHEIPQYQFLTETGPDHDKQFVVAVFIQGKQLAEGVGSSKKLAQQSAAKAALMALKESSIDEA